MIAWWIGAAWATVTLEADGTSVAREGVPTVVFVTDEIGDPQSGETVRVVHRPGLAGEKELAIGITDGRGRVRWTPETAGIAKIRAGEQVQVIRIVGDRPPTTTGVALGLVTCAGGITLAFGLRGPRRAGRSA